MIYFIQVQNNGPIKIGYAIQPEKRFGEIQTCNHEKLRLMSVIPGGYSLETKIHNDLQKYNIHGEWFKPDHNVLSYITNLHFSEYENIDNRQYAVLWRDSENSETDHCPFCGKRHIHGKGDGHRGEHCVGGNPEIIAKDGTKLYQKYGYILRTRKKAQKV